MEWRSAASVWIVVQDSKGICEEYRHWHETSRGYKGRALLIPCSQPSVSLKQCHSSCASKPTGPQHWSPFTQSSTLSSCLSLLSFYFSFLFCSWYFAMKQFILLSWGAMKGRSSPHPLKLAAYSSYISLSSKWFSKLPCRSKCHAFFRYLNLCFMIYNLTALLVEVFWRDNIFLNKSMVFSLLMHLSPQRNSKTHVTRVSGGMHMVLIEVKITVL